MRQERTQPRRSLAVAGARLARWAVALVLATVAGTVGAAIAYLVVAAMTASFALVAMAGVAGAGLGALASGAPLLRRRAPAAAAGVTALLTLLAAMPSLTHAMTPAPPAASDSVVAALRARTIPLRTVEPGAAIDDLRALAPVLENRRVVGMGEATHGTREFFLAKDRLLRFLVGQLGFRDLAMETFSPESGEAVDRYVHGGEGSPENLLREVPGPYLTGEVADMLRWMRAWNLDPATRNQVSFHGIEPLSGGDRDQGMAENVRRIVDQGGPQARVAVWAHNAHISHLPADAPHRSAFERLLYPSLMGSYLRRWFGDGYYALGLDFDHGRFDSAVISPSAAIPYQTYTVGPSPASSQTEALHRTGRAIAFLDIRSLVGDPELGAWLAQDRRAHAFGALHSVIQLVPDSYEPTASLASQYDGLLYVDSTSPPHRLASTK